MKASEKEIKCIDFSLKVRHTAIKESTFELKKNSTPLLISPNDFVKHFWQDYHVTKKMTTPIKGTIFSIIFYAIYVIAIPLVFVFGIIDLTISSFRKKEDAMHNQYLIDYNVSEIKSFEVLWDTKGLRDWGVGFYHLKFTDDDKLGCLRFWCKTLYEMEEQQFNDLIDSIKNKIAISRQKFYVENPNGHITMASPIQLLPNEIQTKYGNYIP